MRPKQNDSMLHVPLTFEGGNSASEKNRLLGLAIAVGLWLVVLILSLLAAPTWGMKLGIPLVFFIGASFAVRFVVYEEGYFKAQRAQLIANDYQLGHNIFWDIYDIDTFYPYYVHFNSGLKGLFISFEKGVSVGQMGDADFNHYEAVGDAYKLLAKRGIDFYYLDYMDKAGNDSRMEELFKLASNANNSDLRDALTIIYDSIEMSMNRSYTTYDVYCFYFNGKEEIFWDLLRPVIEAFMLANYVKYTILDTRGINDLTKSIMNLEEFSVNAACKNVFAQNSSDELVRAIWVEKDGVRTVLNKTTDEEAEAFRIREAEKNITKERKRKNIQKNVSDEEDIEI